jgi:hypothetical protein
LVDEAAVTQAFERDHLVIAFEKNTFIDPAMLDQPFDRFARAIPAIDVVAEENIDRPHGRPQPCIGLNLPQKVIEQIKPTMDVAYGVNP